MCVYIHTSVQLSITEEHNLLLHFPVVGNQCAFARWIVSNCNFKCLLCMCCSELANYLNNYFGSNVF